MESSFSYEGANYRVFIGDYQDKLLKDFGLRGFYLCLKNISV